MRLTVVSCLVLSASGLTYWYNTKGSDFNYGLLIDASASMTADDLKPSRIGAAKNAALNFVNSIGTGSVGVITFTGTSFVRQRLTDDLDEVKAVIENINIENIGGTAIGDALVTGSNLFFSGREKGNVLILMTDGQSNVGLEINGAIPFLLENKVLVHTIGIGTKEGGNFVGEVVTRLDEDSLKFISEETGGRYFNAANEDELKKSFSEIAQLRIKRVGKNLTVILLLIGVCLLLVEWGLMNSKYRSLP